MSAWVESRRSCGSTTELLGVASFPESLPCAPGVAPGDASGTEATFGAAASEPDDPPQPLSRIKSAAAVAVAAVRRDVNMPGPCREDVKDLSGFRQQVLRPEVVTYRDTHGFPSPALRGRCQARRAGPPLPGTRRAHRHPGPGRPGCDRRG